MAQIKFKNLPKFNAQVKRKIEKAISDKRVLQDIGDTALTHVKARMKLSKSPSENKAQKKPSKAWQEKRKQLIKSGKVRPHESFKESQSLVFSGQLVESLAFKISTAKRRISIFAKGNHRPYTKGGKQISNKKLLEYIRAKREVFGLTPTKKKEVINLVKRGIRRALK